MALTAKGWGSNVRLGSLRGVGGAVAGGFGAATGPAPDPTQVDYLTLPGGGPRGNRATAADVAELDRCVSPAYGDRSDTKCSTRSFRARGAVAEGSAWDQTTVQRRAGVAWDTIAELNTDGRCANRAGTADDREFGRCVNWWVAREGGVQNLTPDRNGSRWWIFPANYRLKVPRRGTVAESAPPLQPNAPPAAPPQAPSAQPPPLPPTATNPWWKKSYYGVPTWALAAIGAVGVVALAGGSKKGATKPAGAAKKAA